MLKLKSPKRLKLSKESLWISIRVSTGIQAGSHPSKPIATCTQVTGDSYTC